ncbi:MAG: amidohydrolase family protein, partial [Anaerolineae bacterium]|nr:amidohydrolase family protein [Anaerolineae bacterium]
MLYPRSPLFNRLYDQISHMPVIDCHEHLTGPEARPLYKEPIAALAQFYVLGDLRSAGFDVTDEDVGHFQDPDISTDEKWSLFNRLWRATEHTVYARVTKLVLQNVYGERELTREALDRVAERLPGQTEEVYFRTIDEANIRAMLVDVLGWLPDGLGSFLSGKKTFPEKWRPMISLPGFHPVNFTKEVVDNWGGLVDRSVGSLDDYLEVVFEIFKRCVERGAIGIKDQSAYDRILAYDLVPEAEAERLFDRVLADSQSPLAWPESKPLGDYLFHQFMRFARELDLPVQLHTGYVAGPRSRVDRTNAAYLVSVLEEHQQVRFDLFHGNWP